MVTSRTYKSGNDGYIKEIEESGIGKTGYLGRKMLPPWKSSKCSWHSSKRLDLSSRGDWGIPIGKRVDSRAVTNIKDNIADMWETLLGRIRDVLALFQDPMFAM